ncbi:uncharacterized protein LOC128133622 [Lactuca sativa]|nr:uncharacterized protein LOC128133622 [Lactuca sativa]
MEYLSSKKSVGVWNSISNTKKSLGNLGIEIHDLFGINIKSGNNTLFWYDHWIGDNSLKSKYPNLFELESQKRCRVADRVGSRNHKWKWKVRPATRGLESEVNDLNRDVSNVQLKSGMDQWRCNLSSDGIFSVATVRQLVDKLHTVCSVAPAITWNKLIPIKVICLVWRAAQLRIPIATALERRGIAVSSTLCCSCIGSPECVDHVLINCPFAHKIRSYIWSWCGLTNVQDSIKTISDLIQFASNWGENIKKRQRFIVICYGMLWNLWRFRNKRLFQMEGISVHRGLECIKVMTFYWIKHRGDKEICSWEDWAISPFYDL